MTATDIAFSLRQVFSTLHELQKTEAGETELPQTQESPPHQTLTPQDSIHDDKVICLECRKEMRLITGRHLSLRGISPKEYKKKYGFTMRTPLSAKSLTKARSKAAKKKGLPEKLIQYQEARRQGKVQSPTQTVTEAMTASKQKPMLTPENSIATYRSHVQLGNRTVLRALGLLQKFFEKNPAREFGSDAWRTT